EPEPGAAVHTGRAEGHLDSHHSGLAAEFSDGICPAGRRRSLNRGNGRCARPQHSCGKVAAAAGWVAVAGTAEPLLPETCERRWPTVKCSRFMHALTDYVNGVLVD